MNQVVIGIGSNIEPERNVALAIQRLGQDLRILKRSRVIQTEPVGPKPQPAFLNGAVLVETPWQQEQVTRYLKELERIMGRKRTADKFAPRVIDLDMIIFNGRILDPDFYSRDFLRENVQDVCPDIQKKGR